MTNPPTGLAMGVYFTCTIIKDLYNYCIVYPHTKYVNIDMVRMKDVDLCDPRWREASTAYGIWRQILELAGDDKPVLRTNNLPLMIYLFKRYRIDTYKDDSPWPFYYNETEYRHSIETLRGQQLSDELKATQELIETLGAVKE